MSVDYDRVYNYLEKIFIEKNYNILSTIRAFNKRFGDFYTNIPDLYASYKRLTEDEIDNIIMDLIKMKRYNEINQVVSVDTDMSVEFGIYGFDQEHNKWRTLKITKRLVRLIDEPVYYTLGQIMNLLPEYQLLEDAGLIKINVKGDVSK